jgi:formyl-CoA transferase
MINSPQLASRGLFVSIEHAELARSFIYPGVPYKFSQLPCGLRKRAPLVGEHNVQVYQGSLGLSRIE